MATYEYAERNPVEFGKFSGFYPRVSNGPQNRGMVPFFYAHIIFQEGTFVKYWREV